MTSSLNDVIAKADALLSRIENMFPQGNQIVNWDSPTGAFRWVKKNNQGQLKIVQHMDAIRFKDLFFLEQQKDVLQRNTLQFLKDKPANNVLMTGSRGTGKSSLVRACLSEYKEQGLRVIEVQKEDLIDLDEITDLLLPRPEKFILYCDDLSFDEGDSSYKALKVALDGGLSVQPDNVLIYATSNRRHLLVEKLSDNDGFYHDDKGELHPAETVEEKISVSDRFGIWLSFYPYTQEEYLKIVAHWLGHFGCSQSQIEAAKGNALQWALHRGSRSGRIAYQFARDYAGQIK